MLKRLKNGGVYNSGSCILILTGFLILSVLAAVRIGSASLSWRQFFGGLFRADGYAVQAAIIYGVRLPRICGAVVAGMGLSVSGVILQSITGNELAAPNIIGVNAGAGFAVILILAMFPDMAVISPVFAFCGAFFTTVIILVVAAKTGGSNSNVILTGVAFTALLNAGISFIAMLDSDVLASYSYFSVGGLSGVRLRELVFPIGLIIVSFLFALLLSPRIDTLSLGDGAAAALGINVKALRIICVMIASACAASAVSFAGLLGFVGLIVPHISRTFVGSSMRKLLPVAAIMGSTLVVIADLIGRTLFAPTEIPVGIVMAMIGAPFFFWLLLRKNTVY